MKILVAGIGNVFFGDDGFGPAVTKVLVERIASTSDTMASASTHVGQWFGVTDEVEVRDFGIRGMDLAYALTSGIDVAILVDAFARGGAPGTLYVVEPDVASAAVAHDNHAMHPVAVLQLASAFGPLPSVIRVVGCEPARLADEDGDIAPGLSPDIEAAIEPAIATIAQLVAHHAREEARCTS